MHVTSLALHNQALRNVVGHQEFVSTFSQIEVSRSFFKNKVGYTAIQSRTVGQLKNVNDLLSDRHGKVSAT